MANCECCNNLGSSPKFQFLLSIVVVFLFIVLGVYGISIIYMMNFPFSDSVYVVDEAYNGDFVVTSLDLAYWFGAVVNVLWLMALCSRCCAPCCCQLSDVPHPCSPCCQMWHLLDVPFFVGVVIALFPASTHYQQAYNYDISAHELFLNSEEFILFQDVALALGLVILLLAIPSSFVKWRRMTKSSQRPAPPGVAQMVGNPVTVEASAVETNGNVAV